MAELPPLDSSNQFDHCFTNHQQVRLNQWQQYWLARAAEVHQHLVTTARAARRHGAEIGQLVDEGSRYLTLGCEALMQHRLHRKAGRAALERAIGCIHLAELQLIRIAPLNMLQARLPELTQVATESLDAADLRRRAIETLHSRVTVKAESDGGVALREEDREMIYETMRVSYSGFELRTMQLANFTYLAVGAAVTMFGLALSVSLIGLLDDSILPLCFQPQGKPRACPTGTSPSRWDHVVVGGVGLLGAALAAAFSLRQLRGGRSPWLNVAPSLLKLPTGALTATLGILLMRGSFVPGLTALDNPEQIVAWSVLLGYSQQLFTSFVDNHAHGLLERAETPAGSTSA